MKLKNLKQNSQPEKIRVDFCKNMLNFRCIHPLFWENNFQKKSKFISDG